MVCGRPPVMSILFSTFCPELVGAAKAIDRLSHDQNGCAAPPSMPGSCRAACASRGRSHNARLPCFDEAVNATYRPSGETVMKACERENVEPSGGDTMNRNVWG